MQIFLSHSSKQKPLVREVMRNLPEYFVPWIDEHKLLFGDNIAVSLETAIKSDSDYVLVFIDEYAVTSAWVAKELAWTLESEKKHGRTILLPIVIDEDAFRRINNIEIQNRKYLRLNDYTEVSIRGLSNEITSELFALVCRDMERLQSPKTMSISTAISDADALINAKVALIRKAVFPHRQPNPISLQALRDVVNSQSKDQLSDSEFESILATAIHNNLIPGLYYDGFELYLVEEHSLWKSEVNHERKVKVGRKASQLINNDTKVFIDSGSTTEEIALILCKKIQNRILTRITLATTSVHIANMISDVSVKMGFDDAFTAVQLFVPGGKVRPSTQSIIPIDADCHEIMQLADYIGGFDLGFIGVNGVDSEGGFTTHENSEVLNKVNIIRASKMRLLVGDCSKIGIVLEKKFADFFDDVQLIVDNDPNSEQLQSLMKHHQDKIILA